jgi:hypothetical protein
LLRASSFAILRGRLPCTDRGADPLLR